MQVRTSLTVALILSFVLAGCSNGENPVGGGAPPITTTTTPTVTTTTSTTIPTSGPKVISFSPNNNATGVPINTSINLTFSENMDGYSINANTFTVSSSGQNVSGLVWTDPVFVATTATFTPSQTLTYNTTYTVTVTTGIRNLSSQPLDRNYSWSFTTGQPSNTGGFTFSQPMMLSNPSAFSQAGRMTIDDTGAINVVWQGGGMQFSRSVDGGNTFTPPKSTVPPGYNVFEQIDMAGTANGIIHIAWTFFYSGFSDIFYIRSTDGGANFSSPYLVSTGPLFNSVSPSIATDGANRLGIAWTYADVNFNSFPTVILYSASLDSGNTFFDPIILSDPSSSGGNTSCPVIAMQGSQNVYAAWFHGSEPVEQIFFSRSLDDGSSFSVPVNISNQPDKSWCPNMVLDANGNIYAVWQQGQFSTNRRLLFTKSTDDGATFSAPIALPTQASADPVCQNIAAAESGRVYITWSTGTAGPYEATFKTYLIYTLDGGTTFSTPIEIPVINALGGCPQIVPAQLNPPAILNDIHMVWNNVPVPDTSSIFYSRGLAAAP